MNDAELAAREVEVPNTGVAVHNVTFDEAVEIIVRWAREGSGGYVSTPNVDHLVRVGTVRDVGHGRRPPGRARRSRGGLGSEHG